MERVPTENNMADLLTKGLAGARLNQLSAQMGLRKAEGEEPVALLMSVHEARPLATWTSRSTSRTAEDPGAHRAPAGLPRAPSECRLRASE
jgi:hypothetical protein